MAKTHDIVENSTVRKHHKSEKKPTRTTSYRLPVDILNELETESRQKNISENVLVKQILEKYVNWDRIAEVIGMIQVPYGLLKIIGKDLTENQIDKIVDALFPVIRDSAIFTKGGSDLERIIETLEDFMKVSGMKSDHRKEGPMHHFVIQHGIGMSWSIFVRKLLTRVFKENIPDKQVSCQLTNSTVIVSVDLGSDFDEHTY